MSKSPKICTCRKSEKRKKRKNEINNRKWEYGEVHSNWHIAWTSRNDWKINSVWSTHTPDINVLVHKRDFPILFMNSASWRHIAIQFTNLEQLQTRSHDWMPATHSQLWLTEWVDDALEYAILPNNDSKKKNKTAQHNTTVESEGISGNTYSASSNVSVIAKKTQFITIVAMTK